MPRKCLKKATAQNEQELMKENRGYRMPFKAKDSS